MATQEPSPHLQGVLQHPPRPHGHPEALHCVVEGLDHVGRGLEDVGPHVVHEVGEGVFTAEAVHAKSHVLHSPASRLSVDQVPGGGREGYWLAGYPYLLRAQNSSWSLADFRAISYNGHPKI